jgi:hypothetical protein
VSVQVTQLTAASFLRVGVESFTVLDFEFHGLAFGSVIEFWGPRTERKMKPV